MKCFFEEEIFFIEEYEECEESPQDLAKEKVCVKKLRLIDTIKFSNKSESVQSRYVQSRYNMLIIEDIIIDRDTLNDGFVRIENLDEGQITLTGNPKSSKYRYNLLKVNDSSKLKFYKIDNEDMQSLESTENTIKEFSDIEKNISGKVSPCSVPRLIIENVGHGNYVKIEQSNFTISVDCGGNVAFKKSDIIDMFVLTHWHEDHMYYLDEIYESGNTNKRNLKYIILPEYPHIVYKSTSYVSRRDYNIYDFITTNYANKLFLINHGSTAVNSFRFINGVNINIYKITGKNVNNSGLIVEVLRKDRLIVLPGDSDYSNIKNQNKITDLLIPHHYGNAKAPNTSSFSNVSNFFCSRGNKYCVNTKHHTFVNGHKSFNFSCTYAIGNGTSCNSCNTSIKHKTKASCNVYKAGTIIENI